MVLGPPGVGKPHLAVSLGLKAIEAGFYLDFTALEVARTARARVPFSSRNPVWPPGTLQAESITAFRR